MLRTTLLLLLSALTAESAVHFKNSALIDQLDLHGVQEYKVSKICDSGCHVWASILPGSEEMAKNIHINDDVLFNLAEVATMYDANTKKMPIYIESDVITIYNFNVNQTSIPLIIYIVSTRASDLNTAEIYDAHNFNRMVFPAKQITIMSPSPFTVTSNRNESSGNSVVMRTTGYDDVEDANRDGCFQLAEISDSKSWPGFNVEVSSPMLSLAFNYKKYPDAYLDINTTMGISRHLILESPGFITSPGYIGCSSGEIFRSSEYMLSVYATSYASSRRHVFLNGDIHTDTEHPVDIMDTKKHFHHMMSGSPAAQSLNLFTTGIDINWSGYDPRNSFALRISSVAA